MNTEHRANTEFPNPVQKISMGRERKKINVFKLNSSSSFHFKKGNGNIFNHHFQ